MLFKNSGVIAVTLAAISVSLSSIFSSYAYAANANPQTMIFLRFLCFCLLFLFIRKSLRDLTPLNRRQKIAAVTAGVFFTLGSGSLLSAIYYLPVSLAIVIFYAYPILTMVASRIIDKQSLSLNESICFLLAFIGIVLALNVQLDQPIEPMGLFFACGSAFGMASCYIVSDRYLSNVTAIQSSSYLALTGLLITTLLIVFSDSFNPGELSAKNLLFIGLASLSFAIAFYCMFQGINLIGAVVTAMILNLEPIITIALAVLFLHEQLNALQILGAALVLLAIARLHIKAKS